MRNNRNNKFSKFLLKVAIPTLAFVLLFGGRNSLAEENNVVTDGQLVIDRANTVELTIPRGYRSFNDLAELEAKGIDVTGLERVHISGSGQFSARGLEHIKNTNAAKDVYIVDLRLESHGFIDGTAISWYGIKNTGNLGRTPAAVEARQQEQLQGIAAKNEVMVYHDKRAAEDLREYGAGSYTRVGKVQSERELVLEHGLKYKRFYVLDSNRPNDKTVDEFVSFYQSLPKGTHLHFHCRGGRGRTTTFMLMVDVLENAENVELKTILTRHMFIGSKDLSEFSGLNGDKQWKHSSAVARYEFIKQFYSYAKSSARQEGLTWSVWQANKLQQG